MSDIAPPRNLASVLCKTIKAEMLNACDEAVSGLDHARSRQQALQAHSREHDTCGWLPVPNRAELRTIGRIINRDGLGVREHRIPAPFTQGHLDL
jgi:hypothetical protein